MSKHSSKKQRPKGREAREASLTKEKSEVSLCRRTGCRAKSFWDGLCEPHWMDLLERWQEYRAWKTLLSLPEPPMVGEAEKILGHSL
mgnify:FL=1